MHSHPLCLQQESQLSGIPGCLSENPTCYFSSIVIPPQGGTPLLSHLCVPFPALSAWVPNVPTLSSFELRPLTKSVWALLPLGILTWQPQPQGVHNAPSRTNSVYNTQFVSSTHIPWATQNYGLYLASPVRMQDSSLKYLCVLHRALNSVSVQ
jgi:hypothetical protein